MGAEECSSSQLSGKRTGARTAGGGSGDMGGAAVVLGGGKVTGGAREMLECPVPRQASHGVEDRPAEGG